MEMVMQCRVHIDVLAGRSPSPRSAVAEMTGTTTVILHGWPW
jgi:hypothetical protein